MARIKVGTTLSLWLTAICAVIAVVSFFGLILKDDMVGRLIFGTVWTLVGIYWIGSYFVAKKREMSKT
jgi:uncharacterized membrane protein HdeD (DUF308 family)